MLLLGLSELASDVCVCFLGWIYFIVLFILFTAGSKLHKVLF